MTFSPHPISCIFERVFDRSVIIITSVEEAGVVGLVLTNPIGTTLRQLTVNIPMVFGAFEDSNLGPLLDMPLFLGGPVIHPGKQGGIKWLFGCADRVPDSQSVLSNVWTGGNVDAVSALAVNVDVEERDKVRFFLGYAAWEKSQLRNELERGVWIHARVNSDVEIDNWVFGAEPLPMWRALMEAVDMHGLMSFPRGKSVDRKLQALFFQHYHERQRAKEGS